MAITPQAIKDQEFQIKFRGYDTIEVKAYLELIAEEFFELLEQVRQQVDELDIIVEERDGLLAEKKILEEELSATKGSSEEIQSQFGKRDSEVAELRDRIDALKKETSTLKEEVKKKERELQDVQENSLKIDEDGKAEKERVVRLMSKIDELEKQNELLRSEELDFKSTLVAAQKFTNELKRKSEAESRAIIDKAKKEADRLRQDTCAALVKYPAEIERLKDRRRQVREDLENVLKLCLDNLDVLNDGGDEDYGELYRRIALNDGEIEVEAGDNSLDGLDMNFDLPTGDEDIREDIFSMADEFGKEPGGER